MKQKFTNYFKFALITVFGIITDSTYSQKIQFDASSLLMTANEKDFKIGKIISIELSNYNDTGYPKIEMDITFSNVRNEEGIKRFKEISTPSIRTSTEQTYPLLSFRVEDFDYTNIKVIVSTDSMNKQERIYKFRNHGGIKFDVSTGFMGTNVRDRSYILVDSANSTNKVTQERSSAFRGGMCLLAHLHSRNHCNWNFGGTIGFELNQDTKLSYIAGGSILLGRDQKFVISLGGLMSKVDRLSKAYYLGQRVDKSLTVLPTVKVWKLGWFCSISYNF
ncbi:MAG: hypothetical protein IT267_12215 [Saprospiraceae bacterium]|nr:hypothetical protein [Saprospiraceae bacterium]